MNKKPQIIVYAIVALLVVFGVWSLVAGKETQKGTVQTQTDNQAVEMDNFRFVTTTWVGNGPIYLALEKGFFTDQGLNVELSIIEDIAQRKNALAKGDVDAIGDLVDILVLERDEDVPAVAVLWLDQSRGADGIVVSEDIQSFDDLRGKKVGAQLNFVGESFLLYLLQKNGIPLDEVEIVDMETGAAGAAFVAGKIDAAATWEPWLSKAKDRKGGHVLVSSADEPEVIVDILSVREDFLAENPEVIEKFARAWFESVKYWEENPEEANAIMAKAYNMDVAEFEEIISGVEWPSLEKNVEYFGTPEKPGRILDVADIFIGVFQETGAITEAPDMTKAVDSSILINLYEESKS
ncbi:ABC transporter substrate-binding protein [Patescibacteria group bacterium]